MVRLAADELLGGLNPAQRDAVTHTGGPLLIVAGAGSGKTRVLTHRIAWLMAHEDVSPFAILAITFTNKAAGEMRQRVGGLVGPVAEQMWVSTFHAACVRMLRRDAKRLGFPSSFTIYDQADATRLTGYVVRDLGLDAKRFAPAPSTPRSRRPRTTASPPPAYAERAFGPYEKRIAQVYVEYQARLQRAGAMDFDDLLIQTVRLLQSEPEVLEHYRQRFAHVLVDEYQDTNLVQNELVVLLGSEHRQVTVVGDTDQSIYNFRGADIRNILEFERAFPDATVVVLDQNYRSTQTILDAANAVIANNLARKPKELWTDRGPGDRIVRFHADDEVDEARWVCRELARLHDDATRWDETAVFYRTNAQSRVLEDQLMRAGIPYRVLGGTRFYDRREIKDALAYVRAVVNPDDEVSLRRVLNVPRRGLGDTTEARLEAYASSHGLPFVGALRRADDVGLGARPARAVEAFVSLLDELAEVAADGPAALVEAAMERSGYVAELQATQSIEDESRLENLAELVGVAQEFETVDAFLEQVSLVSDTDQLGEGDSQVTLMTIHSAKGLEYPVVFLVGMEEGVFPHLRSVGEPDQLEEERRLAYVAITRAQQRLYVSHAWSRLLFGSNQYNPPSRFLEEIPADLVEETGSHRSSGRSRAGARLGPMAAARLGGGGRPTSDNGDGGVAGRQRIVETALRAGARAMADGPAGAAGLGLQVGDDVFHNAWGEGVVLAHRRRGRQGRSRRPLSQRGREAPAARLGPSPQALIRAQPVRGRDRRSSRGSGQVGGAERFVAVVERQGEPEARPLAGLALGAHLAAHGLDQAADDRQAEADAAPHPRPGPGLALVEGQEQVVDLAGGQADALVGHRDLDAGAVGPQAGRHRHHPAVGRVLEGVLQQLAQRGPHGLGVGPHERQVVGQVDPELVAAAGHLELGGHGPDQAGRFDRLQLEVDGPRLGPGGQQHLLHQSGAAPRPSRRWRRPPPGRRSGSAVSEFDRSHSAKLLITVRGVLSSWLVAATNIVFAASSAFWRLMSWRATTAPSPSVERTISTQRPSPRSISVGWPGSGRGSGKGRSTACAAGTPVSSAAASFQTVTRPKSSSTASPSANPSMIAAWRTSARTTSWWRRWEPTTTVAQPASRSSSCASSASTVCPRSGYRPTNAPTSSPRVTSPLSTIAGRSPRAVRRGAGSAGTTVWSAMRKRRPPATVRPSTVASKGGSIPTAAIGTPYSAAWRTSPSSITSTQAAPAPVSST